MAGPKFLLDEHVSPRVAQEGARKDLDAKAVAGSDLAGLPDPEILRKAVEGGRILVTYDTADFMVLLGDVMKEGRDIPGIVFVSREKIPTSDIGGLVVALLRLKTPIIAGRADPSAGLFLSG